MEGGMSPLTFIVSGWLASDYSVSSYIQIKKKRGAAENVAFGNNNPCTTNNNINEQPYRGSHLSGYIQNMRHYHISGKLLQPERSTCRHYSGPEKYFHFLWFSGKNIFFFTVNILLKICHS